MSMKQIIWKHKIKMLLIIILYNTLYVYNWNRLFKYQTTNPEFKYILQWTSGQAEPFVLMGIGRQGFIDRNCSYTNCFVTSDRTLLSNYTMFDVIAFAGPQIVQNKLQQTHLPQKRSPDQKYVFASIESAANYPMNDAYFDDFFNWTWTYRLDSDLIWGYIYIKDELGNTIEPDKTMPWMKHEEMLPTSHELRKILKRKSKAAAWFVSHCKSNSKRENYVAKLKYILKIKYKLSVDIYGKCGKLKCEDCDEMIKRDYFFYLAFENSFSEDYVTEKLSRALECNAIPIVYGGADYTRFLSNGSYLDARKLGVEKLASTMNELIQDFEKYVDYFRWTNHYRYYRRSDANLRTNDYCNMCALLNDEGRVKNVSMYKDFRKWWNNP